MSETFPYVEGVTHRFVEASGLRFHVAEAGAGDPILLLHGWPQHWFMWRHVIPKLATDHRVICVDLRGLGWSDAPPSGYEKESMAADMLAVMDALGLQRVKLMGHDWGGFAGFLMCLFQPDRFERYVALNMVHPWPRGDLSSAPSSALRTAYQWVVASPAGAWLLRTQPALVEQALLVGTHHKEIWAPSELKAFSDRLREPDRARASVEIYRTFLARELVPLARGRYDGYRLEVPTLLLVGRHDPAIDVRVLGGFEDHADDMQLKIVDDAGHFIADEAPDLVAAEARGFFGR